ncbi:MFS transporter [Chloroflexota bacterium]
MISLGDKLQHTSKKKPRIFYGWWIVLSGGLISLFSNGIVNNGFTALFTPIVYHFGWSYAVVSIAFSLRATEVGIAAPFLGFIADKVGPRKVAFTGAFVTGWGMIWLSRVDSLAMFYLAFAVVSLGLSGCAGFIHMIAVANWFNKKVGTATGLLAIGQGAGGLLVPAVVWLVALYDWQTTLVILGIVMWVVCLPLSLVIRHKPEQYGYLPDGETNLPMSESEAANNDLIKPEQVEGEYTAREALKTRSFWLLMLAQSIGWMGLSAVMVHIMPHLESIGISRVMAGLMLTLLAISNVVSRFSFGFLGDRFDKVKLLAITLALEAIGLLIFAYARNSLGLIPLLITMGPAWGGLGVLMFTIQRDYFGRSSFGSIRGLQVVGIVAAGIIVPPIVGLVFDVRGSYHLAWLGLSAISAIAVPLALKIKRPVKTVHGS